MPGQKSRPMPRTAAPLPWRAVFGSRGHACFQAREPRIQERGGHASATSRRLPDVRGPRPRAAEAMPTDCRAGHAALKHRPVPSVWPPGRKVSSWRRERKWMPASGSWRAFSTREGASLKLASGLPSCPPQASPLGKLPGTILSSVASRTSSAHSTSLFTGTSQAKTMSPADRPRLSR
eukprot:scaffold10383_cov117-Isochrysis_galbana.AAC.1